MSTERRDGRVQWQIFAGVGVFIAIIDVVYWFVSYERAGTTMLALASGLALFLGVWLYLQDRRGHDAQHDEVHEYLPTTSWWPLVMGAGVALALNGLIISWPFAIPGGSLLLFAIGGLVSDSRRRVGG